MRICLLIIDINYIERVCPPTPSGMADVARATDISVHCSSHDLLQID